jgi:hypothetical protein
MPRRNVVHDKGDLKRLLAIYLLGIKVGDRLERVRDLGKFYNVSVGLVSQAISSLEMDGVVKIKKRGQRGSFLEERSISGLWKATESTPVIIALTLPSNRHYEGLATGLKLLFKDAGINTYFIFIRGSRTRLHVLQEWKCNIAIMSRFAADGLCGDNEIIALDLPAGTFVKAHKVFYRTSKKGPKELRIVAIDYDSYDQSRLTELEFAEKDVQFKEITFMNIHRHLREGLVDATVSSEDDMIDLLSDEIACRSFSDKVREIVRERDTSASLVIRSDDLITRFIIREILDLNKLLEIQQSVDDGHLVPEY